jgi:predicted Holliday junction resolvase-like endonuclease
MTPEEVQTKIKYEAQGYKMLHNGCPDFMGFKLGPNGEIKDIIFVEVKRGQDHLSFAQQVWRKAILEAIPNASYQLEYYAKDKAIQHNPKQINASQNNPSQSKSIQYKSNK